MHYNRKNGDNKQKITTLSFKLQQCTVFNEIKPEKCTPDLLEIGLEARQR